MSEKDPGAIQKAALHYAALFKDVDVRIQMALICHLTDNLVKKQSPRDVVEGLDLLIHQILLEHDIAEDI